MPVGGSTGAQGCPTCAERKLREAGVRAQAATAEGGAPATRAAAPAKTPLGGPVPDLKALSMKDYHRVVRATYHANEGPPSTGGRARAYLPFVLLVVLLVIGAAVIFGHL